jgi:uncharacterized membrane protein YphA (DoxX/SURF4 family)
MAGRSGRPASRLSPTTALVRRGLEPALPLAYLVVSLEVIGGMLIVMRLLIRPAAALAAARLAFITFFIQWLNGFG